jgi:hypothetical protein
MHQQNALKALLGGQTLLLLGYTFMAFRNEGADLFAVFVSNIQALGWNGQFNLDFSCYLILSGLWIAWRNRFSPPGLLIALVATIMGIIVFAPYVLFLLIREKGDLNSVLIGNRK